MRHLPTIVWTVLTAPLAAQTFVVDAARGAGAQFTSIATAIANVPNGAVLRVRTGVYGPFAVVAKDVTVLCESGTVVSVQLSAEPPVVIRDLAASQQVSIRGLRVVNVLGGISFAVRNCAGTVLLDTCDSISAVGLGVGGYLQILDSADVRVRGCLFAPTTGITCSCANSNVRVADSSFGSTWFGTEWVGSVVEFADTSLTSFGGLIGSAPVRLTGSSLRILDGCTLTVNSGVLVSGTGTVRVDPGVTLENGGSAAPFAPGIPVTTQDMPTLQASTGTQGGVASASLRGPNGGLGALYVGLSGPPTVAAPFADAILLAPGTENLQVLGIFGPSLTASYTVPPPPLLLGVRVTWQGVSADATSGVQISNAVTYVHW